MTIIFKKLILPALFLAIAPFTHGQIELTINEALTKSAGSTDESSIIKNQLTANKARTRAIKAAAYPQVQLSGGANYSNASGSSILGAPPSNSRLSGMDYNWQLGFAQPLFTFGTVRVLLKIAEQNASSLQLGYELQMELYYIKVIEAYTMALTAKSMFQASSEDLKFARELGRFTKVELDGGAASQTDYLQVQAKLKLAQADSIQAFLNYQASLDKLKILIGLDIGEQITITPTDTSDWYISAKAQPGERRDLKLKTLDKSIKHNQIKYEKGGLYPFISLVGGMNSNIYDYNNFSTGGPEDLINPDMFNYQVGLQLKWVLFDGLATPSKVKQANYEAKSLERELSKLKKEISIARSEVKRQVQASAAIVGAATSAYEAASTAITQARRDHKEGIMGLSRLLEAETAYKGALVQYHHAVAGKILAHAYYKFAHGIDILEGMK